MRALIYHLMAVLITLPIDASAEEASLLRFKNNDSLLGKIESLSNQSITLSSTFLKENAVISLNQIIELKKSSQEVQSNNKHVAVVQLTNGDIAYGAIHDVSPQAISIKTAYAGLIHFNKMMISSIKIEPQYDYSYRGPSGIDDWIPSKEGSPWKYDNSAFISSELGGISKNNILPDQCVIRFDLAWKSDTAQLVVALFSENPTSIEPVSGYGVSLNRNGIYLRRGNNLRFVSGIQRQAADNDKIHVEIRSSKTSGNIAIFINDQLVNFSDDSDAEKPKFGSWLHFINTSNNPIQISNIMIRSWDESVDELKMNQFLLNTPWIINPKPTDPPPLSKSRNQDNRMLLANGDSISGEITSITDGIIFLKTPLGDIQLPLERLRELAIKDIGLERCIRRSGDVRATFHDESSLVFRLDSMDGESIVGSSQNFSTAQFQLSSIKRIEFNIYNFEFEPLRHQTNW